MSQHAVRVLLVLAALTGLLGSGLLVPVAAALSHGQKPLPITGVRVVTTAPTRIETAPGAGAPLTVVRSTGGVSGAARPAPAPQDSASVANAGQGPRLLPIDPQLALPPAPAASHGPTMLLGQLPRPPDRAAAGSRLAALRGRAPPLSAGT